MSKLKSLGQYFTPASIAQFMISLISEGSKERKILEPSSGKGIFLKELIKKGYRNITGIEIDPTLIENSSIPVKIGNFFDFPESIKFNIVIGNPPYVRWKNLTLSQREYLSSSSFWHKRMNGLTDILQPFIFKSVDHLVDGGELIFITPIFWMQTLHAEPLRRFLLENGYFKIIVNFHEARIFPDINLNLMIFKYRKNMDSDKTKKIKIVNYEQKGKLNQKILEKIQAMNQKPLWEDENESSVKLEFFQARQPYDSRSWRFIAPKIEKKILIFEKACQFSPEIEINGQKVEFSSSYTIEDIKSLGHSKKNWKKLKLGKNAYFQPSKILPLTNYLNHRFKHDFNIPKRFVRLGDVVDIGNGMVSGLDKAFKMNSVLKLNEKEKKLVIPVLKANAIRRYYFEDLTNYFLVKPNVIKSEASLRNDYPTLYAKLKPFQEALEKRYQYNRKIPYWEWVFIRNYNLMKEFDSLIAVPCKERFDRRGYFRFTLCKRGVYATQDVTVLAKFHWVKESMEYITAFLNSELVFEWVTNKGLIRGGVAEFSERPLSSIPFRFINWGSTKEQGIHAKITSLVRDVIYLKTEDEEKFSEINELILSLIKE